MGWVGGLYIIDDSTPEAEYLDVRVDGEPKAMGAIPRDYAVQPAEMFAPPGEIPLIPRSEWSDRIREMEDTKSRLSDIMDRGNAGQRIPTKDQDGHGFCWSYSSVGAVEVIRAINNQPYVDLSAHAVAAIIKNGKDEGGWCGLSAQFIRDKGVPSAAFWSKHSRDYRRLATADMYHDAAKRVVSESWVDLDKRVYDQNLTFDMIMTLLLRRTPVALDFSWWGHSVLGIDPVEPERGSFGYRIRNSWTDGWGDRGTGLILGSKTRTMGAVAPRVTGAVAA